MDYTVHRILQARILEWVAVPFSRDSSQLVDWTQVSHIARGFFISWATGEAWNFGFMTFSVKNPIITFFNPQAFWLVGYFSFLEYSSEQPL